MNTLKTFFLLLLPFLLFHCGAVEDKPIDDSPDPQKTTYQNSDYGLTATLPADWKAVAHKTPGGEQAISIFPAESALAKRLPLDVHEDAEHSFISIHPAGLGTELPSGAFASFAETEASLPDLQFQVDEERSKVFLMDNNSAWAYFMVPADVPQGWDDAGFIFAQTGLNNFSADCYDAESGKSKALEDCDPMEGDRFVRHGGLNQEERGTLMAILRSLSLKYPGESKMSSLIKVEDPSPNEDIRSPFKVEGQAVGYWYFEGSFTIRLYDAADRLLVESVAQAQGEWMTEDFVPFEATLKFDAPDDERGRMVFVKANPSGLEENAGEYSIPVLFPPAP